MPHKGKTVFKRKWYGVIKEGQVSFHFPTMYNAWVKNSFKEGQRIELTLEEESQETSLEMYKFLYGAVYTPISETSGYTVRELDDLFKDAYVQTKGIYLPKNQEISKSLDFNKKEMLEYMEFVQDRAADWFSFTTETPINENWRKDKE